MFMPNFFLGSQASPAFSPRSIPGLLAWYDPSDGSTVTQSSGAVSQVGDQSGNGNHALQSSGAAQLQYQAGAINSLAALKVTANGQLMTLTDTLVESGGLTILAVGYLPNSGSDLIATGLSNGNFQTFGYYGGSLYEVDDANDQDSTIASASGVVLLGSTRNDASTPFTLKVTGVAAYTAPSAHAGTYTIDTIFGRHFGLTSSTGVLFGELLIYGARMGSTHYAALVAYLAAKWGVNP